MSFDRLWLAVRHIFYELIYYAIGFRAILDDFRYRKSNNCPTIDAEGCVAIVTGGSRGIGLALVEKLLQCNMTVIIGCRNETVAHQKLRAIRDSGITSGKSFVYPLDLMSFSSAKNFVNLVKSNHKELHLLINNAGIMFPPYEESEDGFESQWAVNFLTPALLTYLLLPFMEKSKSKFSLPKRIVNVTSCAYLAAKSIDFKNINVKNKYLANCAYAQSKLASILFTVELNRRLEQLGSTLSVHCVHPGIVDTDLFNGTPLKKLMPWVLTYICKTVSEGATSVLFACISPSLTELGGSYTSNCRPAALGHVASSKTLQENLYDYTVQTLHFEPLQCIERLTK